MRVQGITEQLMAHMGYVNEAEPQEKYCAMFGFKGNDNLKENHVTLMWFGEKSNDEAVEIMRVIDNAFKMDNPIFEATFSKEAMFGKDKNERVLLADNPKSFMLELRSDLSPYNGSQFKDYQPHITTTDETYSGTIDRLVLTKDDYEPIQTWQLK